MDFEPMDAKTTTDAKSLAKSKLPNRRATARPMPACAPHRPFVITLPDGKTVEHARENVKFHRDQRVVYPASIPISQLGGALGQNGSLAPKGAIVQVASMTKFQFELKTTAPARCFDGHADAFAPVAADMPAANTIQSDLSRQYADQVGCALFGAVTSPGGKAEYAY